MATRAREPFDLQAFKRRHPIAEVVTRYATVRGSGAYLYGRCPFHPDAHPSFRVSLETGTWQCFAGSCGKYGDVIDLVGYGEHGEAWNARNRDLFFDVVTRLEGGALPTRLQSVERAWLEPTRVHPAAPSGTLAQVLHLTARLYHTQLLALRRAESGPYAYLRVARGLTDHTIRREALGFASGRSLAAALTLAGFSCEDGAAASVLGAHRSAERGDREFLAGRITCVDWTKAGDVLFMTGRSFGPGPDTLKYLGLKGLTRPLMGLARLNRQPSTRPILIVEGPFDRYAALQWGYDAVATLGSGFTFENATRLAAIPRPKVIVRDNDAPGANGVIAGLKTALRIQEMLGSDVPILTPPDPVKDLGELNLQPDGRAVLGAQLALLGFAVPARGSA